MELTSNYAQKAQVAKDARILITKAASGQDITGHDPGSIFEVLAGLEDIQDYFQEEAE
jgi:hypothetical protein